MKMRLPLAMAFAIASLLVSAAFAADTKSPSDRPVASASKSEPIKDRQGRVVAWANTCSNDNCVKFRDAQGRPTATAVRSGRSIIVYDRQGRRK